jgi:4-aminobutyrate aminotransferase
MAAAMRYAKNLTPGIGRLADIVIVRGQGSYVFTDKEEKYLDFATGIGVTGTGHCHPKVVKAIQDQAGKMIHAQVRAYPD